MASLRSSMRRIAPDRAFVAARTLCPRPKRWRVPKPASSARLPPMTSEPDLAWIASVVGDPARLSILLALMDGRARTAKELAFLARVAAPTASGHLAKLLDSRLVAVDPQGRHRYYRIASPLVAEMVEAMSVVAGDTARADPRLARVDPALAAARTCYNHLAGRLGVALADALAATRRCRLRGRGRRGHRTRAGVLQRTSGSMRGVRDRGAACSASPASIGRSDGITLPAPWAPPCASIAWGPAGCSAAATRAR